VKKAATSTFNSFWLYYF